MSPVATPTLSVSGGSPPGVNFTRTAALGLPSPIAAGLFERDSGEGGGGRERADGFKKMKDVPRAAGDTSFGRRGGDGGAGGGGKGPGKEMGKAKVRDEVLAAGGGGGGGGVGGGKGGARDAAFRDGPSQPPRKGNKLGMGARSRTMPTGGTRDSPEGG